MVLVYVIAYIDRTNIAFALPHLAKDMGLSGSQQGFVSGVFFFGYLLLQVPAGFVAERWSGRIWITILMVLWGACAVLCGFAHSYGQLVALRFLLGVAEGGVQPALMTTIRAWFPFSERSRAYAVFKLYAPLSSLIAAPFSGVILTWGGGWRALFIVQGAVPVVIGLVAWLLVVRDTPAQATWLSARERSWIETARQRDGEPLMPRGRFKAAFTSPVVWLLTAVYTLTILGTYGIQLWLPTVLKQSFHSDLGVGLVAMLPPIAGGVAIILVGRSADRRGHHVAHVAVTLGAGAVVLAAVGVLPSTQGWLILAVMTVATVSTLAYYGPLWAMVTKLMPVAASSVGIGLINGVGNLGGFLGPYIGGVINDATGGYAMSQVFFGAALAGAALLTWPLRRRMRELAEAPRTAAVTDGGPATVEADS